MSERKYFVLSLKHLFPWKLGQPLCLWGYKRTADNEPRCFGGYNTKTFTLDMDGDESDIKVIKVDKFKE